MQRFEKILLISDREVGNEATIERAVALAKRSQAQLTVAEVMPPRDLHEPAIQQRREQLQKLISPIQQGGVRATPVILAGKPFLEIIRAVLREKHDLVITTAEGKGRLKQRFSGGTSLHLMRKCPCPVWLMKPGKEKRSARILAAVDTDPDTSDEERNALNTKIMDLATLLARLEQGELHVIHTWTTFGEPLLKGDQRMPQEQVDDWVREDMQRHQRQLDELLGKYALDDINRQAHLLKGEPRSLIPALARDKQADLIVMGTVARARAAGLFISKMAEKVLQQADCSVLTVKPDGFVSPVRPGRT